MTNGAFARCIMVALFPKTLWATTFWIVLGFFAATIRTCTKTCMFAIERPARIADAPNIMLATIFQFENPAPSMEAGIENRCTFKSFCLTTTVVGQEH